MSPDIAEIERFAVEVTRVAARQTPAERTPETGYLRRLASHAITLGRQGDLVGLYQCGSQVGKACAAIYRKCGETPLLDAGRRLQNSIKSAEPPDSAIARCVAWRDRQRLELLNAIKAGVQCLETEFARLASAENALANAYRKHRREGQPSTGGP